LYLLARVCMAKNLESNARRPPREFFHQKILKRTSESSKESS
jgi:hypothetical protein